MVIDNIKMVGTVEDFKKELNELLEKYNVDIDISYDDCSDMHGVYDLRLSIVDVFHGNEISPL